MPGALELAATRAKRWTSRLRSLVLPGELPDAMIIGAQRAGTTSLFHYLAQHPAIAVPRTKEMHFFDNAFDKGERWYRSRLPRRADAQLILEASPYYLFHPVAPERASLVVPAAKLIVLLREPVARAFSHYQHEVAAGREELSFKEAIVAEAERLGDSEGRLARGEIAHSFEHRHFSYVSRGLYAAQIERWHKHYPMSAMLFIKSEDMFRSPREAVDRLCEFLSLPAFRLRDSRPRHQREYPPLSASARRKLAALYEEPNQRLRDLTGIHWE